MRGARAQKDEKVKKERKKEEKREKERKRYLMSESIYTMQNIFLKDNT